MSKLTNKLKFKKEKEPETEVEVLEAYPDEGEEKTEPKKKDDRTFKQKIHDLIWGSAPPGTYNTPETPYPPYCLRARIRRWYYVKYRGWVYYITTMYDRPHDEYVYDMEFIPKSEVPRVATHVTNENGYWHTDLDHPDRDFIAYDTDFGFTAHDADLYIKCNKIDEAMKIELDGKPKMDTMKIVGIVIGVAIAFFVFYSMYMSR